MISLSKPVDPELPRFKKLLTLSEAARYLSNVCVGKFKKADILQLALEDKLKLSVKFINGVEAARAKFPLICKDFDVVKDFDKSFLTTIEEVKTFGGDRVWDLPMIGRAKLAIENGYHILTNGPHLTTKGVAAYVQGDGGELWLLQDRFSYAKFRSASRAYVEKQRQLIARNEISAEEAQELINNHLKQGWESLANMGLVSELENCCYYPAKKLPRDSVLFIRLEALEECAKLLNDSEPEKLNGITGNSIKPEVKRENNFNKCIAEVIADFTEVNEYAPTTVEEVINRMKYKPPLGFIVNFRDAEVSIDGSKPKTIDKLERAIRRLLEQQKSSS